MRGLVDRLFILMVEVHTRRTHSRALRLLRWSDQLARVSDTGQGEAGSELLDILLELEKLLAALTVALGGDSEEIFEQLRASFLLQDEGDLNGTVEEVANLDHLGLLHAARGQGARADTDATGDLGGFVANNRVLVKSDVAEIRDVLYLTASQSEWA